LPLVRSLLRLQTRQPMPRPFEGNRLRLKIAKGSKDWTILDMVWKQSECLRTGWGPWYELEQLRSSYSYSWMCLSDLHLQMRCIDRSGRHFSDFHSCLCIAALISND
jgi:hypothetical protein